MKFRFILMGIAVTVFLLPSCVQDFLDVKPDKQQVVPSTLADLEGLLENTSVMSRSWPCMQEIASDNLYLENDSWKSLTYQTERNAYIWSDDLFGDTQKNDWSLPYVAVFYANNVLEGLEKIEPQPSERARWEHLKGSALFFRGFAFYQLSQLFCKPYVSASAQQELGICLKLSAGINEKIKRSTLEETHQQILEDLMTASQLLPQQVQYTTMPTRSACQALLSRIYLGEEDYEKALNYGLEALKGDNKLLDYNTLSKTATYPILRYNSETILMSTLFSRSALTLTYGRIDPSLYNSYKDNDLRKTLFFKAQANNLYSFKGSYDGTASRFNGMATDELYLNCAECYARKGELSSALSYLNTLLLKRFKTGTFTNLGAANADDALTLILTERRKELLYRGVRWTDLRRLNNDNRFKVTINRTLEGGNYELLPNGKAYVFPIPVEVIIKNGLQQNER